MKIFSRVIVALDNTSFDERLLSYLQRFSRAVRIEKLYAIYVSRNLEFPAGIDIVYKDEHGKPVPKDELLRKVLRQKVAAFFPSNGPVDVQVDVLEGGALEKILHWAEVKNTDLLVLGNKQMSEGSGVLARKVARNTHCSVLFVPETENGSFKNILVPIDFSEFSLIAMKGSIEVASGVLGGTLTAFHAFDVPTQSYVNIRTTYEAFVKDVVAYKKEAFARFKANLDFKNLPLKEVYIENDPDNPAKHIHQYAHNHQTDLIVMAAKGHSTLELLLIGSVTEKLVTYNKDVPVLVLRN